jgi:hypothetical protein
MIKQSSALGRHLWAAAVYLAAMVACAALIVAGGLMVGHSRGFGGWTVIGIVTPICCLGVALRVGDSTAQERLRDPSWVAWLMLGLATLALLPGFGVAATLGSWYQTHRGRPAAALVLERRCQQTDTGECDYEVRLADPDTEQELGWFAGCDGIDKGQRVTLVGSRSGWLAPVVGECAGGADLFPLSAGAIGALAATIMLLRIGTSAWRLRFPYRPRW